MQHLAHVRFRYALGLSRSLVPGVLSHLQTFRAALRPLLDSLRALNHPVLGDSSLLRAVPLLDVSYPRRTLPQQVLVGEEGFHPQRMFYEQAPDVVEGSSPQPILLQQVLEEVEDSYLRPTAYSPVKFLRPSPRRPVMHLNSRKVNRSFWTQVSEPPSRDVEPVY